MIQHSDIDDSRRPRPVHWIIAASVVLLAACGGDSSGEEEVADGGGDDVAAVVEATTAVEPVVGDEAGPVVGETIDPGENAAAPGDGDLEPIVELRILNDWFRALVLNEAAIADPLELERIGKQICEGLTPCRVAMWYDPAEAPVALPVTQEQIVSQVYAFGRTLAGDENSQWHCDRFPEFEAERSCLPQPLF
ncbi:MAG: hypothetical protein ACTSWI_02015 [Alphaproteobacteria bacterium]